MNIKYKKTILIISMSIMGIALLTFSIPGKKNIKNDAKTQSPETTTESLQSNNTGNNSKKNSSNAIKRDAYPEINELIEKYLKASVMCDLDALNELVNNPNNIDIDKLHKESEYIEDYKNIECYTKPGYEEDSYIVYVYEEVKIFDIDTLAPGMRMLYVCTDENGKIYIHNEVLQTSAWDYMQEAKNSKDVQDLIKTVNAKFEEAISSDENLKAFQDKLNSAIK